MGQPADRTTQGRNRVDRVMSAKKRDGAAICTEARFTLHGDIGSQQRRQATAARHEPEIAAVLKDDLCPARVWVTRYADGLRPQRHRANDDQPQQQPFRVIHRAQPPPRRLTSGVSSILGWTTRASGALSPASYFG